MLSEDKIRQMNEIARYTEREKKMERPAGRFFRGDYVTKHLFQSFFAYSLSFALFLGVAFLYELQHILNAVDVMVFVNLAKQSVILYFAGLFVYELITWIVYRRKYRESVRRREKHLSMLNHLKKRYDVQERVKELSKEGGRNA